MKAIFTLFVCAFALWLSACTPEQLGSSSRLPQVGSKHSTLVQVGRAVIPLPEGEWTVVAARLNRSNPIDGSTPTATANAILARLTPLGPSQGIDALVQVTANVDTQSIFWTRDSSCFRDDWLFVQNTFNNTSDQKCMYVRAWSTNFQYNENWPLVERESVDWMRGNNVHIGGMHTFLGTRYRIVKNSDLMVVWYYFSNRALGVMPTDNQWHPVARQNRPEFETAFRRHLDWSRNWETQVIASVEGRLARPVSQPVTTSSPPPSNSDRAARLRELEALRSQGLITQEEFSSRRQRILEGL